MQIDILGVCQLPSLANPPTINNDLSSYYIDVSTFGLRQGGAA